ncbi:ComEC/Rec2 family competence protein [Romboutsia lituseburensis]|uniref:ComEC/Rec2 family competence protein n=1 Tax=Romboutsia lituseburensis TaxID=1537 RepID=UPI00215A927F|nr:MBL fold metallo-hydrolase [Romboutsia lituseburensis]MCR8745500.1 MBL fold metallo-hydrolase [Romboutsia lituseburensis]
MRKDIKEEKTLYKKTMNNKLKNILCIMLIIALGYLQTGCQSVDSNSSNSSNRNVSINKSDDAQIHFIDTGNSDAILIIKNDKAALIDGGDNDDEKRVVNYLKNQSIKELEYVFATHPHADHIGGLDAVVDSIKVNHLYVSNGDVETKSYRDFIEAAANKGLSPSVPLLNSEFKLGNSLFKVLSVANTDDPNNNSIVLSYTNDNDKILLMGDAEADIEKNLSPGDVDLIKIGHHGSHSSSTREFIEKTNPEYAVILVGEDNKYGHPHKETMDLLKEKSIEVHRSDECKDIIFTSTGNGLKVDCKKGSYNSGKNYKYNKNTTYNKEKVVTQETNVSPSISKENTESEKQKVKDIANVDKVYWSAKGKKYHSDPTCSSMKNPISGTIEESKRSACSVCY